MNGRNKQKITGKLNGKLLNIMIAVLMAVLAIVVGLQIGDLLYSFDVHIVENIDSENFKDTMNLSLPIMETIYNSGKSSVSFSGEIKSLFAWVFQFDLDSPVTILNVQSPLFMSYYHREYAPLLAQNGSAHKQDDGTNEEESPGETNSGEDNNKGSLDNGGTGQKPEDGGQDTGKDTVSETGKDIDGKPSGDNTDKIAGNDPGNTGTNTGDNAGTNTDNKVGNDTGNNAGNDTDTNSGSNTGKDNSNNAGIQDSGKGTTVTDNTGNNNNIIVPGTLANLEPISSIAYDAEDDEENSDSNLVAVDKMVIRNFTKHKIDIAKLLAEPIDFNFSKKGPKVLIYHTHTSESYVLKAEDLGKKNVASNSSNPKYNVVRVGEELAKYLKKNGIETLHNATVHDKNHPAAYSVAMSTLKSYMKSYPSIKVYIDIHRDALDGSKLRVVKEINGKNAAQIMFVMGTNDQLPNDHWEENLKFALKVQQKLNEKYPGLARPVWIVGKRYNQHVSNQAVLIEVGGDGNLLSECIESMKYLGEALSEVMNE